MKKHALLLLLLTALIAPSAMNAQTRTDLTVADQTGTSSYVPFYGLYVDDYQHNQTIYPSTMLTEMQGGQITKLTYYLNRSVSKDFGATIEIRLGTTTSTEFSSGTVNYISIAGNPIYTNTDLSVSGTTVEFDFSNNPYTYISGNLVVDVRITSTGSWSSTTWLGESASTCYSAYGYSSSMPTQGNGLTFMPKTTFTYTVSSTPQIILNPSSATVITGSTETLTATTLNVTGTPTITYSTSNANVATVSGSGTTATVTAVSAGTATITATMTYNGNTYTAQCPITVEDPSYCTPSGYGSNDDCIVRFVLGDIDNQTASNSTDGYGDYTNLSTSLEQGETATATVYGGTGSGNHAAAIWIDFDDNYEFETSERVGTTSDYINPSGASSGDITFTIPSDAPAGSHRLRVKYEYGNSIDPTNIDPCTSSTQYGEAEDYTIVINNLGAYTITCATTTGGTISADKNKADENVVITITATPETEYSLTALTYTPEGGSAQNIDITSTPYTFTMPAANVTVNATFSPPACPRPTITDITVSSHTATITTDSDAANFNVKYREPSSVEPTTLSYDFENGIQGWTLLKGTEGNSPNNWMHNTDYVGYTTDGLIDLSTAGHSSSTGFMLSESYISATTSEGSAYGAVIPDNYLVSPQIKLGGSFTFYAKARMSNYPAEKFSVLVSETVNTNVNAFTHTEFTVTLEDSDWHEFTINLSSYSGMGYVAIHHYDCEDQHLLYVDDVTIVEPADEGNEWIEGHDLTITGLTPLTTYEVQVQANCGAEDGVSTWSSIVTFTTDEACPAPRNLTASNLTQNSATISWTGESDSYTVQYRPATITGSTQTELFTEGFENNLAGWTTFALGYSSDLTDWQTYDATNLGSDYNNTNHGGSYVVRSKSYAGSSVGDVTVDNWLISPQMTIGDGMTLWVSDDGRWHEHIEIRVCTAATFTSSTLTTDFALVDVLADAEKAWTQRTVDLSAYAGQTGYIAIRNNDTGKDFICIDDMVVYQTVNSYEYGTATTLNTTTNSCNLTGLTAETLYEVQVQGDCGSDGTSLVSTLYFTTPDACGAPTDLVASNVTSNSATLSWANTQESYNLRYREVYYYESFESESLPNDWTTIDANGDGNTWSIGFATAHTGNNGAYNLSYIYNTSGTTPDDYLVSPLLDLQGTLRVWLSGYGDSYEENFAIYVSTNGNSASDFTTTLVGETTTTSSYVEYTADLSSYAGQQGYIAIRHFNCSDQYYLYVDDFGLYGSEDWVTIHPTEATVTLTDLSMETGYEWQVQGLNCNNDGDATEWSAVVTFTTLEIPAVPVESITVDPAAIEMNVGATYLTVFTVEPADATYTAVTFSSADETVATVDENGTVTGVAAGTTTITIAANDGSGVTGTLTVTVTNIDVEEIVVDEDNISIVTGETATIQYEVLPNEATDNSVTFTSADETIATVDEYGVVTGVAAGETTITIASVQNPEVTTTITVTVTPNPYAVQFTVNAPANAKPGDLITVEGVLTAPEEGEYGGFTDLAIGIYYDNTAFEFVAGSIAYGPVVTQAQQYNSLITPNPIDGAVILGINCYQYGYFVTEEGIVFSAQFTVLEGAEGSFTFTAQPNNYQNFDHEGEYILYEATPSTVVVSEFEIYTKDITAYTGTNDHYYLIASPIGEVAPEEVGYMTENDYDLYYFDQSNMVDGEFKEWVNYEGSNGNFNLMPGKGYLYANSETITLTFTGTAYTESGEVTLVKDDDATLAGWNLVGNPFTVDAYIDRPFYRMNGNGTAINSETETGAINLMEGIFVMAEEDGEVLTFTTEAPSKSPKLALNLTQENDVIDRAIIRLDEGRELQKFQFRDNSTKLSIQQNDKEYAVVRNVAAGEMPLNFKAETNGNYTINVSNTEVEFKYLHLIDNLTGTDVNLLGRDSYSFDANTTDNEARFTLVFRTDNQEPEVAQQIHVNEGWNWWSTYIEMIGINGIQLLENSLGDNGLQIKSQQAFASNSTIGWQGSLGNLKNESMYMINADHADEHTFTGNVASPTDHTIHINSGWNWIGYVQNNTMDINEALVNLSASEGDIIKSQNGFATYMNDCGWWGTLQSLQPGQGYMILADHNATFTYPANAKGASNNAQLNNEMFWNPVIGKFPYNMNVMAVVELNGNELRSEEVELAAFDNNDECRGSAKLMYVKPIDRYVAFLTVQGNTNDPIHFMVRNGDQRYTVNETVVMKVDEVIGSAHNPFKMTIKGAGLNENSNVISLFPNPTTKGQQVRIELPASMENATIEIIDMLGRTIFTQEGHLQGISAPDVAGVYTIRVTDAQGQTFHSKLTVK